MPKHEIKRTQFPIISRDPSVIKETYGTADDLVAIFCSSIRPETDSDTCLVSMHPIGGTAWLPIMREFAKSGIHVVASDSRYRGADYALNMEKVTLDLGATVKYAKERLGYKKVVLLGWSGGGSLSAFYQAQAEHPTVTDSPGGFGPDLTKADLIPADGVLLMAAHMARHQTLTEWIDASILNEADPDQRDPELDIYGANISIPFDAAFVARYREAQIARNRKITAWVKEKLADLKSKGREMEEFAFVTHGTMADPRWLDPSLDPNDRKPGWCYMGDPRVANNGPIGLARFSTLRSWLSQWSYDDANADGPASLKTVTVPVCVIGNSADDACTPSHTTGLYEAVTHEKKELHTVKGATHYYSNQPEKAAEAVQIAKTWLEKYNLI